ncbi:MAG: hypothetical protein QNJ40_14660 [Xanthomonadales bacterium]|nr:hypothetical protein [Xanthomonadales bacterium]
MKLRIRGNSLRIRVTQGELENFAETGAIHDSIEFGPETQLTYRLTRDVQLSEMAADMNNEVITVRVPRDVADEWVSTELVSLRAEQPLDGAEPLKILVEKDFACLVTREGEDDSDAFPNPSAGGG